MTFAKAATLADGQLPAAAAALYTAPALTSAYIRTVRLANVTGGAVTLTLVKRVGVNDRAILTNVSLAAGESLVGTDLILGAGESLRGSASAATSVDYVIEGVQES